MRSSLPGFVEQVTGGSRLRVKVQPRARRNAIGDVHGNELKVSVTAPPVDAAANEALCEFVAEKLKCHRRAIQILSGRTSRHKLLLIEGMDPEQVALRLREPE
jgi:uncharacterized protein (TIGR00251 family)